MKRCGCATSFDPPSPGSGGHAPPRPTVVGLRVRAPHRAGPSTPRPHTEPGYQIPRPAPAQAPRRGPHPARALKTGGKSPRSARPIKAPLSAGVGCARARLFVIATKAVGQARAQPTALVRLDITRALCLLPAVETRPPHRFRAAALAPSRPPPEGAPRSNHLFCVTRLSTRPCSYVQRRAVRERRPAGRCAAGARPSRCNHPTAPRRTRVRLSRLTGSSAPARAAPRHRTMLPLHL